MLDDVKTVKVIRLWTGDDCLANPGFVLTLSPWRTRRTFGNPGCDMNYTEFRDVIRNELRQMPEGLTWVDLRERLSLPYDRPCPEWTRQLERDIGLSRAKGRTRSLVWRVAAGRKIAEPSSGANGRQARHLSL